MNKCIVMGAGFSKSISNLPITKEMFNTFRVIINDQKKLNNLTRAGWGEEILRFIEDIEVDYLIKPYSNVEKGGKILSSNYLENFEGLCSFIDLSISFEVEAICEMNGVQSNLSGKSLFSKYTKSKLKQIKNCISNYLYLSLINDTSNRQLLDKFKTSLLPQCKNIITFNYDLILEKYLFQKGLWFPKDGYGINIKEIPEVSSDYDSQTSDIKILKMHGSLNWLPSSMYNNSFKIKWFDDDNNYFFPNYLKEEKGNPFKYKGGFSSAGWILPSWFKQFQYQELLKIWSSAQKALSDADEIYFIGYSLPRADSTVYAFLSSIDFRDKRITLIDPNAISLVENYSIVIKQENINTVNQNLETFLLND